MTTEQMQHADAGRLDRGVVPLAPKRVQLSRAKGWRMPENTVKVDRSTRWGNPYKTHSDGYPMTPELAVGCFSALLRGDSAGWVMRDTLTTPHDVRTLLRGKNLACWCALDQPCHADVLLRLANHERHNAEAQRRPSAAA
jgi:hypothetical protein